MDFDITLSESGIDYGIVKGNEKLVFIKSGRGGTYIGGEEKYLRMARRINSAKGYTVICASNPMEVDISYPIDQGVIESYISQNRFEDPEINLLGSSNGGYQNIFLANRLRSVRKMICINMPLMINFHKTVKAIKELDNIPKTFVYGSLDPSRGYIPYLELQNQKNMEITIILLLQFVK